MIKITFRNIKNKALFINVIIFCSVGLIVSLLKTPSSFEIYYSKQEDMEKHYGFVTKITFGENIVKIELDSNKLKDCFMDHSQYIEVLQKKLKINDYIFFYTNTNHYNVLELRIGDELIYSFQDVKYKYFNEGVFYLCFGIICLFGLIYSIVGIIKGYSTGGFFTKKFNY